MSQLTNFGENKLADKIRGTEPPYAAAWHVAFASAADDGTFTEITGADLPRVAVTRSPTNWSATNGLASTVNPSTGTTKTTTNLGAITFSAAVSDRGVATHAGLCDASSGGNVWVWTQLPTPLTINATDAPVIAAGDLVFAFGVLGGATHYLVNKMVDEFFRGVAYPFPASMFGALYTTAPTDAGGGVELSAPSYARPEIESTAAAWSGTQAPGSTSASSGSGGRISNNAELAYPVPLEDWGDAVNGGLKDAGTLGNLLWQKNFASPKSIRAGGAPANHAVNTLGLTFA